MKERKCSAGACEAPVAFHGIVSDWRRDLGVVYACNHPAHRQQIIDRYRQGGIAVEFERVESFADRVKRLEAET